MTARDNILAELAAKVRTPWELNGFNDGLTGRDDRVPEGRMSTRDAYMMGWRDGNQVRLMTAAAYDPPQCSPSLATPAD